MWKKNVVGKIEEEKKMMQKRMERKKNNITINDCSLNFDEAK